MDFDHDPVDGCGCDLCVAFRAEMDVVCDAHRDGWIGAMEADGGPLPWEIAWEPANDCTPDNEVA